MGKFDTTGGGRWITWNGRHIFIKDGQNPDEVIKSYKEKAQKKADDAKEKQLANNKKQADSAKSATSKPKTTSYKGYDIEPHGNGYTVFVEGDEWYFRSIDAAKAEINKLTGSNTSGTSKDAAKKSFQDEMARIYNDVVGRTGDSSLASVELGILQNQMVDSGKLTMDEAMEAWESFDWSNYKAVKPNSIKGGYKASDVNAIIKVSSFDGSDNYKSLDGIYDIYTKTGKNKIIPANSDYKPFAIVNSLDAFKKNYSSNNTSVSKISLDKNGDLWVVVKPKSK